MDTNIMNAFAEMFDNAKSPTQNPDEVQNPVEENKQVMEESAKVVEESVTTEEESADESETKIDKADDKSDDKSSVESTDSAKPFPKKDLGMGGASFCDEILKMATPEILAKLKSGEKTMAGCWNWVYSYMRNEYIKSNGCINGGIGSDCSALVERYFSEIPEGTVEEEYKSKVEVKVNNNPIEVVKKVAKRAAKNAKKENKVISKTTDNKKDNEIDKNNIEKPVISFPKIDYSKLFGKI